jgi:TetR/AcrR family transcriptional regulator
MVKDNTTESQILDAARKIFLEKGMAAARMQEIADEAGINKALLHYYFRSKEKLFERIFGEVIEKISGGLQSIFEQEMSILNRLNAIIDVYIDVLYGNRYLPLFVLNEMNYNPERFTELFKQHIVVHMQKFFTQIQQEVNEGRINPIHPLHLLLNVLGLIIFPFATIPVISRITDEKYKPLLDTILQERKQVVKQFIENALTPKVQNQ